MNIALQKSNFLFGSSSIMLNQGLKSTQQKAERQAKCENQVAFWENQKEGLKKIECDSLDEIARKLDMLHSYEKQIIAVKAEYNQEQMFHILDEAIEMGEKVAEQIEKTEPKTPEERKEEMAKEALGIEETEGVLSELLKETEEIINTVEEVSEETLLKEDVFAETLEKDIEDMEIEEGKIENFEEKEVLQKLDYELFSREYFDRNLDIRA